MKTTMKLLISLILAATKQTRAQCSFAFCGGLENMPDQSVVINESDPVDQQMTCADLFEKAQEEGVYNDFQCEQSIKLLEPICCPASATRQCFLCGDSDISFNASKTFAGFVSCGDIDKELAILPSGEFCDAAKSSAPMDVTSFCECPGAVAPNTCKLCKASQEFNASAAIPGTGGLFTCADVVQVASHVNNVTACDELTKGARASCCIDKPSTGSNGIKVSISSLVTALAAGLAISIW